MFDSKASTALPTGNHTDAGGTTSGGVMGSWEIAFCFEEKLAFKGLTRWQTTFRNNKMNVKLFLKRKKIQC